MKKGLITCGAVLAGGYLYSIMPSLRTHSDMGKLKTYRYAHRGLHDNASDAPENSLRAFAKAADAGYGIELDVQLSKDDIPVIMHDFVLGRIARDEYGNAPEGKVRDYTFEELQKFFLLDSDQRIPSFAQVLELVNGRVPLIVEYKTEEKEMTVCEKGNELLKDYRGLYCVESFNPMAVNWYRIHRPDIIRGQLSDAYTQDPNYQGALYAALEYLMLNWKTKPDFIAFNRKHEENLSRKLCRKLFHNTAVGWTIKDEDQLIEAKQLYDIVIFDSFVPKQGPRVSL
ncbi:MAG: hypothetical protein IJ130_13370 [Solobacterium sp.]|nr:hypothetical protein [Solobacterium sp.]